MANGSKILVDMLTQEGVLKTPEIIDAFKSIDRRDFVLEEYKDEAYGNYPLPIGYDQTISQPLTVAFMLELLEPKEGEKILDVGSGSGWATALLANIVKSEGNVWGMEIIPELVQFGQENLAKYPYKQAEILQASKELGLPSHAPFDKILVSAGDTKLPQELVEQLKIGGIMVIPVEEAIWRVTRESKTNTKIEKFGSFLFVPLVH